MGKEKPAMSDVVTEAMRRRLAKGWEWKGVGRTAIALARSAADIARLI
jgi:hypothetical protein